MNGWEISFGEASWETVLNGLPSGSTLSASSYLTWMESAPEEAFDDGFSILDDKDILLDVTALPVDYGSGDTAVRLRREQNLVESGKLLDSLDETDPLKLYLLEMHDISACENVDELIQKLSIGDGNAAQQLVNAMLPEVTDLAFAYVGHGVLLLDLIQEGSLGLWQALQEEISDDVFAHCRRRIAMAMSKAVARQARQNGIGQGLRGMVEDYRSVDQKLLVDLGRNPTVEEIANAMHIGVEQALYIGEMHESAKLLAGMAANNPPEDTQQEDLAVEDTAYFQMRQRIAELLSNLPQEDAELLSLRFGLDGKLPKTPEEVGHILHLTSEQVVAKEAAALALLRSNQV